MPRKAKIPCSYQGCPTLIESGTGNYCKEHMKLKNKVYSKTRDDKETITEYKTARWQRVRKIVLQRDNYLCQICKEKTAEMVDHIVEVKDGGAFYELSNLQSLCNKCHALKTKQEEAKRSNSFLNV